MFGWLILVRRQNCYGAMGFGDCCGDEGLVVDFLRSFEEDVFKRVDWEFCFVKVPEDKQLRSSYFLVVE